MFLKTPMWGFFTLKFPWKKRISSQIFRLYPLILRTCLHFLNVACTSTLPWNPLIATMVETLVNCFILEHKHALLYMPFNYKIMPMGVSQCVKRCACACVCAHVPVCAHVCASPLLPSSSLSPAIKIVWYLAKRILNYLSQVISLITLITYSLHHKEYSNLKLSLQTQVFRCVWETQCHPQQGQGVTGSRSWS